MAFKSVWRNCFPPDSIKDEFLMKEIKTPSSLVDSPVATASCKYIAYACGNTFRYSKLDDYGRGKFKHCGPPGDTVRDLQFSPFQDDTLVVARGSDVRVERVPGYENDEEKKSEDPSVEFEMDGGHSNNVLHVRWHPTVMGVVASASKDSIVKLWDVSSGQEKVEWNVKQDKDDAEMQKVFSMEWSQDGSLMAVTTKEQVMWICDPRLSDKGVVAKFKFEGKKKSHAFFAQNINMVGATCFNKQAKRFFKTWDMRKFGDKADPLYNQQIDNSSSVLFPLYDADTFSLFTLGKGDTTIGYYHLQNLPKKKGYIFPKQNGFHSHREQTVGGCLVPKRAMDTTKHEVCRVIKMTKDMCIPISWSVMLKDKKYKPDLYPDAFNGTPSADADSYFDPEKRETLKLAPITASMDPKKGEMAAAMSGVKLEKKKPYNELAAENAELKKKIEELEAKLAEMSK